LAGWFNGLPRQRRPSKTQRCWASDLLDYQIHPKFSTDLSFSGRYYCHKPTKTQKFAFEKPAPPKAGLIYIQLCWSHYLFAPAPPKAGLLKTQRCWGALRQKITFFGLFFPADLMQTLMPGILSEFVQI